MKRRTALLALCLVLCLALLSQASCRDPYEDAELEMAWAAEIYKYHKGHVGCLGKDETLYLERLTRELLKHARRSPYKFTVCITDVPDLNAYALPAGHIYVHRGLLEEVGTEAQLAFVLAHEISHVLLRHAFYMQKKLLFGAKLRERLLENAKLWALPAALFGAAGLLKFSRHYEKNADLKAQNIIAAAGFDPRGSVEFMELLRTRHFIKPSLLNQMFSTHPRPDARIRYLRRRINRSRSRDAYRQESADFLELKRRFPTPGAERKKPDVVKG